MRWPTRVSIVTGALVAAIGGVVLLGWAMGDPRLASLAAPWPAMRANSALGFALAGAALVMLAPRAAAGPSRARRRLGRALAGAAVLLGAATLAQYGVGDLGIDRMIVDQPLEPGRPAAAGRMAPAAALALALLGGALLLGSSARWFHLFQAMALASGLIGWLGLSESFHGGAALVPVSRLAVHSSVAVCLLAVGTLCLRRDRGLARLLASERAGGTIARRLIPVVVAAPILFAWLRFEGQRRGWFADDAGLSLFALASALVSGGLVWLSAELLDRADHLRRAGERKVEAQLARHQLLGQVTRAIDERLDLRSIFRVVVRSLEDELPVDLACVCRREADDKLTVEVASASAPGLRAGLAEGDELSAAADGLGDALAGHLLHEGDTATSAAPLLARLAASGLRSLVVAPLADGDVVALLIAGRREPRAFSSPDCEFLRQLAEHVSLAARQARLHGALQESYDGLRQSQQAVLQQERLRALGQMASGIAHDINNAISPAALYAESLLEQEPGLSERGREHLRVIARAIDDVAATVGRMREFYRLREPQLDLVPVSLERVAHDAVELTRARWSDMPQRAGVVIDLRTEIAADLPAVLGVEPKLRDAIINLILNAVDAMPDGGTLTVRAGLVAGDDPAVLVEVSDTGAGMDDEVRRRCLEPFFTTKGPRGTGLGLAQVYGAARRHGAELAIESQPGRGTTVRLRFPVARDAPLPEPAAPPVVPPPMHILVIDDDPMILRSMRDALEGDGHAVATASSGREGIDAFGAARAAGEPFALVITDLGMPHMDGRTVARTIKEASPSTPVLLLTGWGRRPGDAGDVPPHVDRVLGKPPRLGELRAALAGCTGAPSP